MSEERLRREVRRALDRGYRPLGAQEADRILRQAVEGGALDGPRPERGPWARGAANGRFARRVQHSLAAIAAVAIAAVTVATLLGVRGVHPIVPAGLGSPALDGRHLDALRESGRAAVAAGRNDATVASFLGLEGTFAGGAQVARLAGHLEAEAPLLESRDPVAVGRAAPDAQRTAVAIHVALLAGLPARTVIVSLDAQELWAYEGDRLVLSTPVTTGRPATPTSVGPMRVIMKARSYQIKSPWPRGDVRWYPTTTVQYMVAISTAGDGLHDAPWQPCCYGPGSERSSYGTHGTVNVPQAAAATLYDWAAIGTPVVVVPGDGSPVSRQRAAITAESIRG
jgi:L,D-transpeptidase catalytic domain